MSLKYIFAGESVRHIDTRYTKDLIVFPPISRGGLDIIPFDNKSIPIVIILDGVYGSTLSITPTECREFLVRGGRLIGASSIGAIRACDLWPVGMIGVGQVYNMLRLGYIRSDADIAVSYNSTTFEEVTVSIVHIRSLLSILEEKGYISLILSRRLLFFARSILWFERYWDLLLKQWKINFQLNNELIENMNQLYNDPKNHPKKKDALEAIHLITAKRWPIRS